MAEKRKPVDWDSVERDYRAGMLSLREIAAPHGITEGAIRKKAKALGWERDLTARVNEKVRNELVRNQYATENKERTEKEIIDTAAATVVQVVRNHRVRIRQGNDLVELLTKQLTDVAGARDTFEAEIDAECAEDKTTERRARLMKAVSLGTHAQIAVNLATATKTWVGLERQAFNIPDLAEPENPADMTPEKRLARIAQLQAKLNATEPT